MLKNRRRPKSTKPKSRDPYANQRNMAAKRARKRNAFVESVDPLRVFERDRWRCHLCGKRVRRDLRFPHPGSASLDHVVPLSRHGEHSYANVSTAHLGCNVRKGNRGGGEQLALIG